jgi:Protein of unknown function (DUF2785)
MQDITELATQKAFLQSLVADDFHLLTEYDPCTLLKALLPNLGSTNGELRDQLTYPIMARIILDDQGLYPLTDAQLEELLLTCIDEDHLFCQIGEAGTDSVFMRAFSSLIVAAILYADNKTPRISEAAARRAMQALLTYAGKERDWRGYVKDKGWAHSVAHLSDALDECAKNRYTTAEECGAILETLTYLAQLPEPLSYEEDDRLAYVAYGIIRRQSVDQETLREWITSLIISRPENVLEESGVVGWNRAANARNFLRSLYFMLQWSRVSTVAVQKAELQAEIDQALQKLNELPVE